MRLALLNDIHLGVGTGNEKKMAHQRAFFEKCFFPYLKKHDIKDVFILGDLFDKRKYIDFKSLYNAREFLLEPLRGFNTFCLVGNHDVVHRDTNRINSPRLLLDTYNIQVFDGDPVELKFGSLWVGIVPWVCDENSKQVQKFLKSTSCPVIFGHFDINGFEMQRGVTCKSGYEPKTFERFHQVISGHYHLRSVKGNIAYLGTQFQLDWGDYGEKKGFHILDTETRNLEFIPSTIPDLYHKLDVSKGEAYDVSMNDRYVKVYSSTIMDDASVKELLDKNPDVQIIEQVNTQADIDTDIDIDLVKIMSEYIEKIDGSQEQKIGLSNLFSGLYTQARSA